MPGQMGESEKMSVQEKRHHITADLAYNLDELTRASLGAGRDRLTMTVALMIRYQNEVRWESPNSSIIVLLDQICAFYVQ